MRDFDLSGIEHGQILSCAFIVVIWEEWPKNQIVRATNAGLKVDD